MMPMQRAVVMITVGVPLWCTAGWLGYAAADRALPVHINVATASPRSVEVGGEFRIEYVMDRFRACDTSVSRRLYTKFGQPDQRRHALPSTSFDEGDLPIGRDLISTRPLVLPAKEGEEGPAMMEMRNCYVCNITHYIWPICRPPLPVYFEIVARKD